MSMAIDKPARAVQCSCGTWLLIGQCNQFKVCVEAKPLSVVEYAAERVAGNDVYCLSKTFGRKKLRMLLKGDPLGEKQIMRVHKCGGTLVIPLDAPSTAATRPSPCMWQGGPATPSGLCGRSAQEAAQGIRSCGECDPPPFDHALPESAVRALFVGMLGAKVIEVIEH